MVSIKDYAARKGVSYEAVRKQVARCQEQLEGHITIQNRTQYLDDDAVAILDAMRATNPVIIQQVEERERIKELEAQLNAAKDMIIKLQNDLVKEKSNVIEAKDQILALSDSKGKIEAAEQRADLATEAKVIAEQHSAEALRKQTEAEQGKANAEREAEDLRKALEELKAAKEEAENRAEQMKSAGLWKRIKGWRN